MSATATHITGLMPTRFSNTLVEGGCGDDKRVFGPKQQRRLAVYIRRPIVVADPRFSAFSGRSPTIRRRPRVPSSAASRRSSIGPSPGYSARSTHRTSRSPGPVPGAQVGAGRKRSAQKLSKQRWTRRPRKLSLCTGMGRGIARSRGIWSSAGCPRSRVRHSATPNARLSAPRGWSRHALVPVTRLVSSQCGPPRADVREGHQPTRRETERSRRDQSEHQQPHQPGYAGQPGQLVRV